MLDSCRWLQHRGWDVTYLPVGKARLRVGSYYYACGNTVRLWVGSRRVGIVTGAG